MVMKVLLIIFFHIFLLNISTYAEVKSQYLGSLNYEGNSAKAFYEIYDKLSNDSIKIMQFDIVFDLPTYYETEDYQITKISREVVFNCSTNVFYYTSYREYYYDDLKMTTKIIKEYFRLPNQPFFNAIINEICLS